MFKLLLISALVAGVLGAKPRVRSSVPMLDGRIVGGEDAYVEDYPYQISLRYNGRHICGGSIIASNKVLTAAHCTEGTTASSLSIRYGSSYHDIGGVIIDVSHIRPHFDYDAITYDYDVAVLKLDADIVFNWRAQKIDLIPVQGLEGGRTAVVTGWGKLIENGNSSLQLQVVTVKEVDRNECDVAYGNEGRITNKMICFADDGKDSCQGDSGGPLVVDGKQVGIVSWGWGCARPQYPGVYSHVAVLKSFIESFE